ncbi:MAG: HDOD domain-containing protein [Opitutales bacterium]|nr:HDOD domain-containing protein [Opitutales bacterium]
MVNYTEQDLLRTIGKIESLHACAQVLAKAFEILNDPDSNQIDLVDTIKTDSSLTSDIMRISNSAYYGGALEISSLEDAIHRLGFREVMKLISISMSRQIFNKTLEHYGISALDYWMENAAVAATMENFADLLDEDRSYFFTLGLLHSIGRLVIDQTLSDRDSTLVWDGSKPSEEWEVENFGFDFTDSGHVLLTSWNFPQRILSVILNQLTPERVNNPTNSLMALNYSIRWCKEHRQFRSEECGDPEVEEWMSEHEVTQQDLMELQEKSTKSFQDLRKLAGV